MRPAAIVRSKTPLAEHLPNGGDLPYVAHLLGLDGNDHALFFGRTYAVDQLWVRTFAKRLSCIHVQLRKSYLDLFA